MVDFSTITDFLATINLEYIIEFIQSCKDIVFELSQLLVYCDVIRKILFKPVNSHPNRFKERISDN